MYEVTDDIKVCLLRGVFHLTQLSQEELAELYKQDNFKRHIKKRKITSKVEKEV